MKTISVVGNGEVGEGLKPTIDDSDWVVRFNCAPLCGVAGQRTDTLVMMNRGFPGSGLGRKPESINQSARSSAKEFLFACDPKHLPPPYSEGYDDGQGDATRQIVRKVVSGRPYLFIPAPIHEELIQDLSRLGAQGRVIPSTGALAIAFLTHFHPDAELLLFGFSHEGWEGHGWDAERQWMAGLPNIRKY